MPLGLAYVAAAIEASGRRVAVVDAVGEAPTRTTRYFKGYLVGLSLEDIVRRIPAEAELVGVTVVFTHEWPAVVRLVDLLKQARPEVQVVLGGEQITSMPEFCLETSEADYVVMGEGEETAIELIEALEKSSAEGEPPDLSGISGLAYRDAEGVIVNPRRARRTAVDEIPPPAWNHFEVQAYDDAGFVGGMHSSRLTMPILATRGCPYQCTYCSSPNMWTPRWIPRSPAKVVDEIESYVNEYGAGNFPFQDLTAIVQKKWVVEFCQEIIQRGLKITWQMPTGTRSEAIDDEVAVLLRESGMTSMAYAPESGSAETRKLIKKQMRSDKLFESMKSAVAADLSVACFLVIGFPHDNAEDLKLNLPFVDEVAGLGIADCSVGFYMALPGTQLFHSLYDAGRIKVDRSYFRHILSALQLVATQSYCDDLSEFQLTLWKFRILRRFYSRKKSAARDGGFVTSVRRAVSGVFGSKHHTSKLQTVFRNASVTLWNTLQTKLRPGWMSRSEEVALFASWDDIYRTIRQSNLEEGVAELSPSDTRQLHEENVIPLLRRAHGEHRVAFAKVAPSNPSPAVAQRKALSRD